MGFRSDFLWGGATAANQYEGGWLSLGGRPGDRAGAEISGGDRRCCGAVYDPADCSTVCERQKTGEILGNRSGGEDAGQEVLVYHIVWRDLKRGCDMPLGNGAGGAVRRTVSGDG